MVDTRYYRYVINCSWLSANGKRVEGTITLDLPSPDLQHAGNTQNMHLSEGARVACMLPPGTQIHYIDGKGPTGEISHE